MSGETSSAGNAALVISGGAGVVATVNEYAKIIGLSLSVISICIGLYFHISTARWRKEQSNAERERLRAEIIKELNLINQKANKDEE